MPERSIGGKAKWAHGRTKHFGEAVRGHAEGYGIDPRPRRSGVGVRRIANRQPNEPRPSRRPYDVP
jgi:hypothetical protein